MATTAGSVKGRARFTAACGVLSRYVKAAAAMEAEAEVRPVVALPLMPGADVSTTTTTREERLQEPEPQQAKTMTIFYGGRVVVLDDVPADQAAELLRFAAAGAAKEAPAVVPATASSKDLLLMTRKASLQRFMEKRKGRAAARATPYSRPGGEVEASCPDSLTLKL